MATRNTANQNMANPENGRFDKADYPAQPVVATGLAGRCPRCGEGRLFASLLKPVERCAICGLEMEFAEEGDGPAVFVILLLGFLLAGLALSFEYTVRPPVWLHLALWPPVTLVASIVALRAMKGIMIVAQYRTRAAEGRLSDAAGE